MGLKLNGSSSGSVELNAPASTTSGADVVLTLPVNDGDANQFLQTNGSGALSFAVPANLGTAATASGTDLQFNSGYGSVATAFGVRAWARVDGSASATMDADGGFTSFTDNGTGDFSFAFDNTFPDANYAVVCSGSRNDGTTTDALSWTSVHNVTTSGFDMRVTQTNSAFSATASGSDLAEVIGVVVVR